MFDLKRLVESYSGDLCWLKEIEKQINNAKITNKYQNERIEKAKYMIDLLYKLNYIVIETETNEIAEKYYNIHDIYGDMKYDLTELLGITDFWEMV